MTILSLRVAGPATIALLCAAGTYRQLSEPVLPATPYAYSNAAAPLPRHLTQRPSGPPVPGQRVTLVPAPDNTPANNPITDAGATLGRVLFYDVRLSANNTTSCASCHLQAFGFGDTARFSVGLNGKRTGRRSMALANSRFYPSGKFFWDERSGTLEDQVLRPIQDSIEMGMSLDVLVPKLQQTRYYPELFSAAFGTPDVSSERIALALAQFVRSLVSAQGLIDPPVPGAPRSPARMTIVAQNVAGALAFANHCATCHIPNSHSLDSVSNTGLDSTIADPGAGGGRFKAPSLRNIAVRPPYMHDGRFKTLLEVVDFYDHGVQNNPNLDPRLRAPDGSPKRLKLTAEERASIAAYLEIFTDSTFLTAPKFSNPFPPKGS